MEEIYKEWLKRLLKETIDRGASDLHLCAFYHPVIRVERKLIPLKEERKLSPQEAKGLAFALMNEDQQKKFEKEKEIDFSFDFENNARFRVNIFYQMGKVSAALRYLPFQIKTISELNLPPILYEFAKAQQGFVLICGPASHGKSTTLAAILEQINKTREVHIITIEDPIEYVFQPKKAIIVQREVGFDTKSFHRALRSVFREDPDVIMIGEMRDPETIAIALTAAETGHLVFATLHTNSAAQSIHRIVDSFPGEQQNQIRAQLSGSLTGIVSLRLIPRIKGGLIPACEVMLNTPAIANLIRENKIHEIQNVIETSPELGMISLNRYLADLVKNKEISIENALKYSLYPKELRALLKV